MPLCATLDDDDVPFERDRRPCHYHKRMSMVEIWQRKGVEARPVWMYRVVRMNVRALSIIMVYLESKRKFHSFNVGAIWCCVCDTDMSRG